MSATFEIDKNSICSSCKQLPTANEHLCCRICKNSFHVLCPNVTTDVKWAPKTTVTSFKAPSVKPNFLFMCDACLTKFEIDLVQDVTKRINFLESKVANIDTKLTEIYELLKTGEKEPVAKMVENAETEKNVWNDSNALNKIKASPNTVLVVGKTGDSEKDISNANEIEDIILKNELPLKNSYKNKEGDLVLVCDTVEDRAKLQEIVHSSTVDVSTKVPSTKRSPISVVGFNKEYNSHEFANNFLNQNSHIKLFSESVDFNEHFKIRVIKPLKNDASKFQAFCFISDDLQKLIRKYGGKIMIGLNSCKVYEQSSVKRCNLCQGYGHYARECSATNPTCGKCSLAHSTNDCTSTIKKCVNCSRSNITEIQHYTYDHTCPSLVAESEKMKQTNLN